MLKRIYIGLFYFGLALLVSMPGSAQTQSGNQDYVIKPGDLLAITFWQRPEFNTEARVTTAGTIELPLIGTIQAAGMKVAKLRDNLLNRISLLDVRITQASVVVRESVGKAVYITGGVLAPGKKNFEVIPNLWQIILEAGGPQPSAALNDITIIRGSGPEMGRTIHVDLAEALERGDLSSLPKIYPGDYINVPSLNASESAGGAESPPSAGSELSEKVHVFGYVNQPGSFELATEKEMDLFDAFILAGGPTDVANLKDVRIYFRGRRQSEVAYVDMEHYMRHATPLPLMLHAGDAIYVPRKKAVSPFFWEITRVLITTTASFIVFRLFNR